jgi:hypothetical protein
LGEFIRSGWRIVLLLDKMNTITLIREEHFMLRIFIVVCGVMFAQLASAGFMAEPFLGLESGSVTGTDLSGASFTPTQVTTFGLGTRLGYRWAGFWTGLEASYFTGTGKTGSTSSTITDTNAGLMFGYDFSNKYRLAAGYMVMSNVNDKDDSAEATYKGTAFKVSVGYFFQPRMTVNVEYLSHSFSKVSSSTQELNVSDVYGSLKNDPILLTFGYLF